MESAAAVEVDVTIEGWLFEYWLADAAEMERLVSDEPERRYNDSHKIRWALVAATATSALIEARLSVADPSPLSSTSWDVTVRVSTPTPLSVEEHRILASLFAHDAAVADFKGPQLTNGRHRLYYARTNGSETIPVQSSALSAWTADLFGDESLTNFQFQLSACGSLNRFWGEAMTRTEAAGADSDFLQSIELAIEATDGFLRSVATETNAVDSRTRRLVPTESSNPTNWGLRG